MIAATEGHLDRVLAALQGVRHVGGNQFEALCPAHDDSRQSLRISIGDNDSVVLDCRRGCDTRAVLNKIGLELKDLFAGPKRGHHANGKASKDGVFEGCWDYEDEQGKLLQQVLRFRDPDGSKRFVQRRPTAEGSWEYKKASRQVPFMLGRLVRQPAWSCFVVEGEKCAITLTSALGQRPFCVTTLAGGAQAKWPRGADRFFAGRNVYILPDNDDPGREYAERVAQAVHGVAATVRVVTLPGLTEKGDDVADWLAAGHTIDELRSAVESSPNYSPPAIAAREIKLGDFDETRVTDEAIDVLASTKRVFQRGGAIVQVVRYGKPPKGIELADGTPRITPAREARIHELLASGAKWKDDGRQVLPPERIVKKVIARGEWDGIPRLEAVIDTPALRNDGSIISAEGYDEETGLMLVAGGCTYPDPPDRPTLDHARTSIGELYEIVADFPFSCEIGRAAWLAIAITAQARYAFNGPVPLGLFDANVPGAGKGKAADTVGVLAGFDELPRMVMPTGSNRDEEIRKKITSIAMSGQRMALIDNVVGLLGSPSLDAALTATRWIDRGLGSNELVDLPLRVTWLATANNAVLGADTSRRCLHIRLESPLEKPEQRTDFRHPNLISWVRRERPRLVIAALTILRAFFVAGRPSQSLPAWGSFEAWSSVVREAIVWAGEPDPVDSRATLSHDADPQLSALRLLIANWHDVDDDGRGRTIKQTLDTISMNPAAYEGLRAAIAELTPDGCKNPARSLGMRFHHLRGRVVDGKFLDSEETKLGRKWSVKDSIQGGTRGSRGTNLTPTLFRESEREEREKVRGVGTSPSSGFSTPDSDVACVHPIWARVRKPDGDRIRVDCSRCGAVYGYEQPPHERATDVGEIDCNRTHEEANA